MKSNSYLTSKLRLGRLALFILNNKIPKIANGTFLSDLISPAHLLEKSIMMDRKTQTVQSVFDSMGAPFASLDNLVPFAFPTDLADYEETNKLEYLSRQHTMEFLFGDSCPWQVRDYLMGRTALASKKEVAARITEVMKQPNWEDCFWLDNLDSSKRLTFWKTKWGVEQALVHEMAFVDACVKMSQEE